MFNLGAPELIILLIIAILVFGPDKLPEMGANLGRSIREFRKMSNDMTGGLTSEFQDLTKEMKDLQKELTDDVQGVTKDLNDSLSEIQGVMSTEANTLNRALRIDQADVALNPPPSNTVVAGPALLPSSLPSSFPSVEGTSTPPGTGIYGEPLPAPETQPAGGSAAAMAAEAAFFASLTARQLDAPQTYAPETVADAVLPDLASDSNPDMVSTEAASGDTASETAAAATDEFVPVAGEVEATSLAGEPAIAPTEESLVETTTDSTSATESTTESTPLMTGFAPAPGLDLTTDAATTPAEADTTDVAAMGDSPGADESIKAAAAATATTDAITGAMTTDTVTTEVSSLIP